MILNLNYSLLRCPSSHLKSFFFLEDQNIFSCENKSVSPPSHLKSMNIAFVVDQHVFVYGTHTFTTKIRNVNGGKYQMLLLKHK